MTTTDPNPTPPDIAADDERRYWDALLAAGEAIAARDALVPSTKPRAPSRKGRRKS